MQLVFNPTGIPLAIVIIVADSHGVKNICNKRNSREITKIILYLFILITTTMSQASIDPKAVCIHDNDNDNAPAPNNKPTNDGDVANNRDSVQTGRKSDGC